MHDYIHVADVARANVMAMASDLSGEVFNVVTGVESTVKHIVGILLDIAGSALEPEYTTDPAAVRATSSPALRLSRQKIGRMLGWEPEISVEDGIRRLDPDSAFPEYFSGGVEVTLADGRVLHRHVRVNSGAGERAMTTDAVAEKFLASASLAIPMARAERIRDAVLLIEQKRVADLAALLRPLQDTIRS